MLRPVDTSPDAIWKQRYRAPSIFYATIAPLAPDRGLVWTNQPGTLQFFSWDVAGGTMKQLTHTPGGHNSFLMLSPDGRWVYFLNDSHGNEIGHYVRMPYAGGEAQDITPGMPPYSSFFLSFSRCGNRLGFTTAGGQGFSIYIAELGRDAELGEPRLLYQIQTLGSGPQLSADGRLAVVMSSERTGKNEFELVAFDVESGKRLGELWDGEGTNLRMFGFSPVPGDPRLLATSNRSGFERLLIWNPQTGERTDLNLKIAGAQDAHDWSPDGRRIIVSALSQAVQTVYMHDLESGETRRLKTPSGDYRMFFSPDGSRIFAEWEDASHNPRLVEIDPESGGLLRSVLAPGSAPAGKPMISITFPSTDGKPIQGWLCLPAGQAPFATILETHGGPTSVMTNNFNPTAQAWLDLGFAYCSINYHGSTTFGREFEQSIWHDLGHWEVEDMVAAHNFLVNEGFSRADAIFLTGWSYGGYLTLQALGKYPERWAGGMAGIAITDWSVQWEDTSAVLRGYQEALLGGKPDDVPERYRASSPVTYASSVRAPVLIIQGRNDTRTPARPVQLYEQKMRELGKEITVDWFDTGHMGGFADPELAIRHQEMIMSFALDVLRKKGLVVSDG